MTEAETYFQALQRMEDIVHQQNLVIDKQYSTIMHLEEKIREYENMSKAKRL